MSSVTFNKQPTKKQLLECLSTIGIVKGLSSKTRDQLLGLLAKNAVSISIDPLADDTSSIASGSTKTTRTARSSGSASRKVLIQLIKAKGVTVKGLGKKTVAELEALLDSPDQPDPYTAEILAERLQIHKTTVLSTEKINARIGRTQIRLPCFPEDISENIIKFILHNILNDKTSRWDCTKGDLVSQKEGRQECKCFSSDGPLSFSPSSEWDVIYFLDALGWRNDIFVLYRLPLKTASEEWQNIMFNTKKKQTFRDQATGRRRPHIGWDRLLDQISSHVTKVFEGSFNDIFTPREVEE
jgi:hypothetical protein